jgi:hypothetical protein
MQDSLQSQEVRGSYELVLPADFDDYAHAVEWKQWFGNALVRHGTV